MEWMGHADIQTTQKYLAYKPRRDAAKRLAAAFDRTAPLAHHFQAVHRDLLPAPQPISYPHPVRPSTHVTLDPTPASQPTPDT
jgi:hypothetical protein